MFIFVTILCIAASKFWEVATIDGSMGEIQILYFIPYLTILGVQVFSTVKIRMMLSKDTNFAVNSRLYAISVFLCVSYLLCSISLSYED